MNTYNENLFKKLKEYTEIDGMSRFEDDVVAKLKESTHNLSVDYERDGLGSLIIQTKQNKDKKIKILVAAHMDEIGLMVLDVTEKGFIKVKSVGGIWGNVLIGAKVQLITSTDKEFFGVVGHTSVHILESHKIKEALKVSDLFVDFGFASKKEAEEAGVQPGDRIYLKNETFLFNNKDFVAGKAIDNRSGVVVIDELAHRLANKDLPNNPILVGTVQEEVGSRGAKMVAKKYDATIAFAIDTGASHDTEGAIPGIQKLGAGVAISVADAGTMMDPKIVKILEKIAKKYSIPFYKYVSQGGGTDADELQFSAYGTPTVSISIPQRYLHSTYGVVSLKDIEAAINLIEKFILEFDNEQLSKVVYK